MQIADERIADDLIGDVVRRALIPSEAKRQALVRELRSHLEDCILAAREAGHSDDEIRQLVLARFGDPGQVGEGFAWFTGESEPSSVSPCFCSPRWLWRVCFPPGS